MNLFVFLFTMFCTINIWAKDPTISTLGLKLEGINTKDFTGRFVGLNNLSVSYPLEVEPKGLRLSEDQYTSAFLKKIQSQNSALTASEWISAINNWIPYCRLLDFQAVYVIVNNQKYIIPEADLKMAKFNFQTHPCLVKMTFEDNISHQTILEAKIYYKQFDKEYFYNGISFRKVLEHEEIKSVDKKLPEECTIFEQGQWNSVDMQSLFTHRCPPLGGVLGLEKERFFSSELFYQSNSDKNRFPQLLSTDPSEVNFSDKDVFRLQSKRSPSDIIYVKDNMFYICENVDGQLTPYLNPQAQKCYISYTKPLMNQKIILGSAVDVHLSDEALTHRQNGAFYKVDDMGNNYELVGAKDGGGTDEDDNIVINSTDYLGVLPEISKTSSLSYKDFFHSYITSPYLKKITVQYGELTDFEKELFAESILKSKNILWLEIIKFSIDNKSDVIVFDALIKMKSLKVLELFHSSIPSQYIRERSFENLESLIIANFYETSFGATNQNQDLLKLWNEAASLEVLYEHHSKAPYHFKKIKNQTSYEHLYLSKIKKLIEELCFKENEMGFSIQKKMNEIILRNKHNLNVDDYGVFKNFYYNILNKDIDNRISFCSKSSSIRIEKDVEQEISSSYTYLKYENKLESLKKKILHFLEDDELEQMINYIDKNYSHLRPKVEEKVSIPVFDPHKTLNKKYPIGKLNGIVRSIAFSHDGKTVVASGSETLLQSWNVDNPSISRKFEGHNVINNRVPFGILDNSSIWRTCFSADDKHLISCAADETIRVWDPQTATLLKTLKGHESRVYSVDISPDGQHIVSSSRDGHIRFWKTSTGCQINDLEGHKEAYFKWVLSVAYSHDGKLVASGSKDQTVRVWDAESGEKVTVLNGHTSNVYSVKFTPNDKFLLSASDDRTVRVWQKFNVKENVWFEPFKVLSGPTASVNSIDISLDGRYVVAGSDDGNIYFWNIETGVLEKTISSNLGAIDAVALSCDGMLAVGYYSGIVQIWY